jgi:hypothetical protein
VRFSFLFVLPLALAAQTADSDQQVTRTLISEIQQLRLAIERSTLLNARTQLAVSQLQLQESSLSRIKQQLDDARSQAPGLNGQKVRIAETIKQLEQNRTTVTDPREAADLELRLKEMRLELDQANAMEQVRSARESDLAVQLQTAQADIADARSRIAEMERALDAAIQQMLKRP